MTTRARGAATALFEPSALWNRVRVYIARRDALVGLLALSVFGGLIVASATEIGVRHFNTDWNYVAGYSVQRNRSWLEFVQLWLAASGLSIAQGLAGALLLPMYGRPRDWRGAVAVGIVGAVPIYIAGATLVLLPGLLIVCVAFLVSCSWWGSGARLLLGVPSGEAADFVVASLVSSGVAVSLGLGLLQWA